MKNVNSFYFLGKSRTKEGVRKYKLKLRSNKILVGKKLGKLNLKNELISYSDSYMHRYGIQFHTYCKFMIENKCASRVRIVSKQNILLKNKQCISCKHMN